MSTRSKTDQIFYTRSTDIFIESATLCSFSAAAKRLKISQSSVSQTIKHMEQALGFDLFERDTRPLKLTQEASLLLEKFVQERNESHALIDSIRTQNRLKPQLSLGVIDSVASFIGVQLTSKIKNHVSQLSVYTGAFERLFRALTDRDLDIAIFPYPIFTEDSCSAYLLFEEPWVMLFPKSYPFKLKDYSWQDMKLCGLPFLHASTGTANGRITTALFERLSISLPKVFEIDNHSLTYQFVQGGLGWTVIQGYGPPSLIDMPGVRVLPPPHPLPKRKVYMLVRKGYNKGLAAFLHKQVITIMKEELEKVFASRLPWFVEGFTFGTFDEVAR